MESAVRLIVKAPNQQIEDHVVNCQLDWTIARLKDHLAEVYPSKPKNSEQKLIYSGHLLKDNACLKDVLRNYEDSNDQSFIVHLVCASNKNMEKKPTDKTPSTPNVTPIVAPDSSRQNEAGAQAASGVNNAPPLAQLYSVPGFYGQLNSQQIVWMQHAYIQYLSQYMQLMAAQGIQMPNNVPYMQALNDPANGQTNSPNNNRDNDAAVQRRGQEGDAAFDEADENGLGLDRDWLESFFVFLRVIVLFGIVYLYSSPTRFIIVTLLGFAIHLYQGGFLRVNNQVEENARVDNIARADNANNARVENNQNQNNNQANEVQPNETPVVEPAETQQTEGRTNVNEEHEVERPGALAFTWMFFSSFFASLIPDQPI